MQVGALSSMLWRWGGEEAETLWESNKANCREEKMGKQGQGRSVGTLAIVQERNYGPVGIIRNIYIVFVPGSWQKSS